MGKRMIQDADAGYSYYDKDRKPHAYKTYLCHKQYDTERRLHIDGFKSSYGNAVLNYIVPMNDINPYQEDYHGFIIPLHEVKVTDWTPQYTLDICPHEMFYMRIPLIPASGKGLCFSVTKGGEWIASGIQNKKIVTRFPFYDFEKDDSKVRERVYQWFYSEDAPEMYIREGADVAVLNSRTKKYYGKYFYDLLLLARERFFSDIDSGIHIMVGDEEYIVPRTDAYFAHWSEVEDK